MPQPAALHGLPRPTRRDVLARRAIASMGDPDGVVIPLVGLLAHTRPAYGGRTWPAAVSNMMADEVFSKVVHDLLADMDADVPIREPVSVQRRRGQRICNGMHRIVAHVLAGRSTILASTADSSAPLEVVEMQATLVGRTTAAQATLAGVDYVMDAWMPMMSMPVGQVWAEPAYMSSVNGNATIAWYVPHAAVDCLVSAVRDRASDSGYDVVIDSVELADSNA